MNWEGFKVDVWMGFDFQAISWKGEFFVGKILGLPLQLFTLALLIEGHCLGPVWLRKFVDSGTYIAYMVRNWRILVGKWV